MIKFFSILKSFVRNPIFFVQSFIFTPNKKSDVKRWQEKDNLKSDWDERTILIASLIPADSSVLEFGAARLILREHLPSGCSYQAADLIDRGADTIVCDLNVDFPKLSQHYTHAVFSGVLEYIRDINELLGALRSHTDVVIASYATTDKLHDYATRRRNGWINHLSDAEFIKLFGSHGYQVCGKIPWRSQTIYIFAPNNSSLCDRMTG